MQNIEKQIVPSESTAKEVSFEWSHLKIFSTESKVQLKLHYKFPYLSLGMQGLKADMRLYLFVPDYGDDV